MAATAVPWLQVHPAVLQLLVLLLFALPGGADHELDALLRDAALVPASCPFQKPPAAGAAQPTATLLLGGDVSLARDVEAYADEHRLPLDHVFARVRREFAEADVVVVNLEAAALPRADQAQKTPAAAATMQKRNLKKYELGVRGDVAAALANASIDVVGLSNNHMLDFGPEPVRQTMLSLRQHGIGFVGISAGDPNSAQRPYELRTVGGVRIGFLAYCTLRECDQPRREYSFGPALYSAEVARQDIAHLKQRVDAVVVLMHWGPEYSTFVDPARASVARELAAFGASVVVGHHPHVVQRHARLPGEAVVAYSLGNLVFDSHACWSSTQPGTLDFAGSDACRRLNPRGQQHAVATAVRRGRLLRLRLAASGAVVAADYLDLVADPRSFAPQPAPGADWVPVCSDSDPHCESCA